MRCLVDHAHSPLTEFALELIRPKPARGADFTVESIDYMGRHRRNSDKRRTYDRTARLTREFNADVIDNANTRDR